MAVRSKGKVHRRIEGPSEAPTPEAPRSQPRLRAHPRVELTDFDVARLVLKTKHPFVTIDRFRRGYRQHPGTRARILEEMGKLGIEVRERPEEPTPSPTSAPAPRRRVVVGNAA